MKSTDPAFTGPAMDVIRKADPDLAKQIDAAPEPLVVFDDPVEAAGDVMGVVGLIDALDIEDALENDYGMTIHGPGNPPALENHIWLNRPELRKQAKKLGVPVADITASILAHEFRHHEGGNEAEAYAAGSAFAHKTGDAPLAAWEDKMAKRHHDDEWADN